MRRAGRGLAAHGTLGLVLAVAGVVLPAAGARAQVERVEIVAAAPVGEDGASAASLRGTAVDLALAQAVDEVARELAGGALVAGEGPGDEPAAGGPGVLGGDPVRFTLRYRVIEDYGERHAPQSRDPGALEYAVRVEVHVDVTRVVARLRQLGIPVVAATPSPLRTIRLELREVPSWGAYAALRRHLLERAGARSARPESFEAGRVVLRVEAPGGAQALLDTLLAEAPAGLALEPLAVEPDALVLRLRELAPSPERPESPSD